MIIPIIILHHNEYDFLDKCIDSIIIETDFPYEIYIIDNNSYDNELFFKNFNKKYPNINIILNKKNNWLYGFNLAINNINSQYYVLTDADIRFPKRNGTCWLTHLVGQMEQFPVIGKLGLSLSLKNINKSLFPDLYTREKSYKSGMKIGTNIISPVDTTAAIYRKNLFISGFKMRIGHMSLIKPYFYCCRSSSNFECDHLGWSKYENLTSSNIISKINFFGRHGIIIDRVLLNKVNFIYKYKYFFSLYIIRTFHFIKVIIFWLIYILKKKFRGQNEIQEQSK